MRCSAPPGLGTGHWAPGPRRPSETRRDATHACTIHANCFRNVWACSERKGKEREGERKAVRGDELLSSCLESSAGVRLLFSGEGKGGGGGGGRGVNSLKSSALNCLRLFMDALPLQGKNNESAELTAPINCFQGRIMRRVKESQKTRRRRVHSRVLVGRER